MRYHKGHKGHKGSADHPNQRDVSDNPIDASAATESLVRSSAIDGTVVISTNARNNVLASVQGPRSFHGCIESRSVPDILKHSDLNSIATNCRLAMDTTLG